MKHILLPTDFSKNAYSALRYATKLFAEEKCTFIFLHSFKKQMTQLTSIIDIGKKEVVLDELYKTYEAKCDEVKNKITLDTDRDNHTFKTITTTLSLSRAINKLIVKKQIDFVVMGSKGSGRADITLVGSNTLSMIQKIKKAPLLVVPEKVDFTPIKKIAFATGFKRTFGKIELQPLMYLSSLKNAVVNIIRVQNEKKLTGTQLANSHQLFKLLKQTKTKNNCLTEKSNTYNSITSYLKESQIDLFAMIYYKHNAIVRLFRNATVKNMANYTGIPFLVLPAHD